MQKAAIILAALLAVAPFWGLFLTGEVKKRIDQEERKP